MHWRISDFSGGPESSDNLETINPIPTAYSCQCLYSVVQIIRETVLLKKLHKYDVNVYITPLLSL